MSIAERIAADGSTVVPVLPSDVIARLLDRFAALELPVDHPFFASSAHGSRAVARAVDQELKAVLHPLLASLLPGQVPFLAAFISKGAVVAGPVEFHQDWTYTDERTTDATLVWIPLVDVDDRSGALRMIDGSHRWTSGIRPSQPASASSGHQRWFASQSREVALAAGEAVVYHPGMMHGSYPNEAERQRVAVAIAFAPEGAPLVHFHRSGESLEGFVIDESYFTTEPFASRPTSTERYAPWTRAVEPADFGPTDLERGLITEGVA